MKNYNPQKIEQKWQKIWEKSGIYKTPDNLEGKENFYHLVMFPYPSGDLHIGHWYNFAPADVYARFKRMQGFNVMSPIGFDAFGLPAENAAIKYKLHPKDWTYKNIERMRGQLGLMGACYDWSREINTTDPEYYKWTQWIFLKLFEKGLAYQAEMPINWCPSCKTGLANEEVVSGNCERCGTPTDKKILKQWMIKITKYADRLIDDLEKVDYLEKIKIQQINWIGKSFGAEVDFLVADSDDKISVFTTRADTLFGVTALVLTPEHPLTEKLIAKENKENKENKEKVKKYIEESKKKSDFEREKLEREKTGVFTGSYCLNPANNEKVPIWIGDYVIAAYGGGAVMVVPAHDKRDFEFAKKYGLEIKSVIVPGLGEVKPDKNFQRMINILKEVNDVLSKKEIKVWFNGTFGVIGYYGKVFDFPADIDCGVLTKDFEKAKIILEESNYKKVEDKENKNFKVSIYKKDNIIVEIGTFDHDLGDKIIDFNNIKFRVPDAKWFAECYRVTAEKQRRAGKNDLDRAIYLELISNSEKDAFVDYGVLINSGKFSGLSSKEAIKKITAWLEEKKLGRGKIQYKLRDWVFSRQHYWGEPIPIIHCEKCGQVAVPEKDLPLELPFVEKYQPTGTGESPLAAISDWVNVSCPKCGGEARRETDTMPNWAGSNWYYMRYCDPKNDKSLADPQKLKYWLPVDWYNGGMEHTTLHLLYSRFIYKFLFDIGVAPTPEPYQKRTSHGMVLADDGRKMSKSFGNVVNPDKIVEKRGADTLRVYEMFMGQFDQAITWNEHGIKGAYRFLEKVWKLVLECSENKEKSSPNILSALHKLNKKIDEDLEAIKFNTIIAAFMEFINFGQENKRGIGSDALERILILLSPFAPHIAEELWEKLGHKKSIFLEKWPEPDPRFLKEELATLVIQINGKMRDSVEVEVGISEKEARELAISREKIKKWLGGKEIKKVIFVPEKLISIVV